MRYKNTKTGAIIDSSFSLKGKNWEEYNKVKAMENKETEQTEETEEVDLETLKKDELIEIAKENEIDLDEKDTKAVIIEKIVKAFE